MQDVDPFHRTRRAGPNPVGRSEPGGAVVSVVSPWRLRLAPAAFLDAVVVDAEVVGHLVEYGLTHQFGQFPLAACPALEGSAVEGQAVGGHGPAHAITGGSRVRFVTGEQDLVSAAEWVGWWDVRDLDHDGLEMVEQWCRQRAERVVHEPVEAAGVAGAEAVDRATPHVRGAESLASVPVVHDRDRSAAR